MNDVDLQKIYARRFGLGREFQNRMWQVLCADFFQKFIPKDAIVVEIAAGYCEFINNIGARTKIAVDLNPDIRKFANDSVQVVCSDSTDLGLLKENFCDVVFISNFFEHLKKEDIIKTVREAHRILKENGRLLVLQPNVRFCYQEYWNFFDHITPLDDRSLAEVLEINGFRVIENRPKFLPYTTKSKFPKVIILMRLYLKIRVLQHIFGKQAFIVAEKTH